MPMYLRLLLGSVGRTLRSRNDLLMENLVLRQQLAVYARRQTQPRLRNEDRVFWSVIARRWPLWRIHLRLVQPETVIRWHRTAWRRYWTWKSRRPPGRPRIDAELRQLIRRIARENPRWGAVRIVGELRALGFTVSSRTVRRYRREVLRRPPSQSWRTFLQNHAPQIWAVDLFTVQTATLRTLYVIVFIGHGRRRIVHLNVTRHPTAPWIWRQLLEATPWGVQPRHLIRDRARSYGRNFIPTAARLGIETLLSPVRAPNANAVAERVIGTLRRECLDHMIVLNERHLARVLHEYVDHYNAMRPHRTLGLDSPRGREPRTRPRASATVARHKVLGGLQSEYEWAA
jgi:transposase InsO family protein